MDKFVDIRTWETWGSKKRSVTIGHNFRKILQKHPSEALCRALENGQKYSHGIRKKLISNSTYFWLILQRYRWRIPHLPHLRYTEGVVSTSSPEEKFAGLKRVSLSHQSPKSRSGIYTNETIPTSKCGHKIVQVISLREWWVRHMQTKSYWMEDILTIQNIWII